MFTSGTIVKVLIPNVVNNGYDYRLTGDARMGQFVSVTVMNRKYIGVVYGVGDSGLSTDKIKDVVEIFPNGLSADDLSWLRKMSEWTLMAPGAVLRLVVNVPDAFLPVKTEQMYVFNFDAPGRMTDSRQIVADAFSSNDNDAMSVNDIKNITHVSSAIINTMIKKGILTPTDTREKNIDEFVYNYYDTGSVTLNAEQQTAANEIATAMGLPLGPSKNRKGEKIK